MDNRAQHESTSLFMAAIDGGYCILKRDDRLTISFASSKALRLTGDEMNNLHLADFMTPEDKREFFKAYRPHGVFSVKCNLIIDNKLVPTTLKCNSKDDQIYCDITIQADWFKYAAQALQEKLEYERLVNYSNTYLFAVDLKWNFINYTANFKELLNLHELDRNLQTVLTDSQRIHPDCEKALNQIFSLNAMYKNDVVEYLKVRNRSTGTWDTYRLELRVIFNKKQNYAEFIVGSFVDVKSELAQVQAENEYRDKDTGVFKKEFLKTQRYCNIVTGKTNAAYLRFETSKDLRTQAGYEAFDKFYNTVYRNVAKICDMNNALAVRMGDNECLIVQAVSSREQIKQCLIKISDMMKRCAAESKVRGCITCGVVSRINNMDPISKLLDDAYYQFRVARSEGVGKVIFNVE